MEKNGIASARQCVQEKKLNGVAIIKCNDFTISSNNKIHFCCLWYIKVSMPE